LSCASRGPTEPEVSLPNQIDAFGYFSFSLPSSMSGSCFYGVDSYLGEWKSETSVVFFDFGLWSGGMADRSSSTFTKDILIDGKFAHVVYARVTSPANETSYPYFVGIHFPLADEERRFKLTMTVQGKQPGIADTAMAIFRSIAFRR
jgi:hypothetical protein